MKPITVVKLALAAVILLLVVLVQVVKSIDVDRYRGLVSRWVMHETGREIAFSGPLTLKLSLRPALVADGVTLANRAGGAGAEMIRLDHVEAEIGLLPLLSGEVRMSRILVDGADILLEQDSQGQGNWEFSETPVGPDEDLDLPATALKVTELVLEHVAVHVQNPADQTLIVNRATLDADGPTAPIALTLDGQWSGRHLAVSGVLGSMRDAFSGEKPFSLRVKALLPGVVGSAEGTLKTMPHQGLTVALTMTAELNDSADLDPLIGLPLPSLGSARGAFVLSGPLSHPSLTSIEATIGRHDTLAITVKGAVADPLTGTGIDLALGIDGDAVAAFGLGGQVSAVPMALSGHVGATGSGDKKSWRIADLKGTLGHSDITGQVTVGRRNGHGVVDGHFDSALVDLTRPPAPSADTGHALPIEGRLFSDDPLPLHILAASDGHIAWRVARLVDRRLDVRDVALDLDWREGKLAAQGSAAAIAGGTLAGGLSIDARMVPPAIGIDLSVSHLSVGDLLTSLGLSDAVQGAQIDLRFKSSGSGGSFRAIMASQQGSSLLSVGPTQIATRPEDAGLGILLNQLAPGGDRADMRCLISQFTLIDGLARSEALLFALGPQTVSGQGSINLANESLDFTLTPRPDGQKVATPLDVGGTLLHPAVTADKGAIVKNMPAVTGDAASPLMGFAGDGNPCFAALGQGRRSARPGAGGLR